MTDNPAPPQYQLTSVKFGVGDPVRKVTGDYQLDGTVVGVFMTLAGKVRYVVEHAPMAPGMLHIYGENNLAKREEAV